MSVPKENNMNVFHKLNAAREEFHTLKLTKTGRNTFANYSYFELGDFLLPAMQVFAKHGLCALPVSFTADTASMTIVNVDKPDEVIRFESPMGSAALKGCHEVQNIGAVETYQRRYLWVAAMEIVEHDALDATTGKGGEAQQVADTTINTKQLKELQGLVDQTSTDLAVFCAYYKIEALPELPDTRFSHAKAALLKKIKPEQEAA